MPNRPKQRVLVRWNDDLDKALLLFISHICAESGIKIPYDEVARRMGSTFTEGAITQHLSKLRTKMAELNVVPVPDAPKRGAVTNKPSSVYAQKGRAGPAPPQPIASKTQAKRAAANAATAGPNKKRATRRKPGFIKRSESDDGQSEDEFDGGSDDDFVGDRSTTGRRKRSAHDVQGQAQEQANTSDKFPSRIGQSVNQSIENMADRGFTSQFGQTAPSAPHDEEEEPDHFPSNLAGNIHQMPRNAALPATHSPISSFPALGSGYHSTHPGAGSFEFGRSNPPSPFGRNTRDLLHPSNIARAPPGPTHADLLHGTYAPRNLSNDYNNQYMQGADVNRMGMNSSYVSQPALMPQASYGTGPPSARNGSMTSSSTQMTFNSPTTPMVNYLGLDSVQRSPFDVNDMPSAAFGSSSFDEPDVPTQITEQLWGSDGQFDLNSSFSGGHGDQNTITDDFVEQMFS